MDNRITTENPRLTTAFHNTIAHLRASDLHLLLPAEADLEDSSDLNFASDFLYDQRRQLLAQQLLDHLYGAVDNVAVKDPDAGLLGHLLDVARDSRVEVDNVA